jgi:lysophospholipid acyltransferase (LPLAT)-like uncharacterized protein
MKITTIALEDAPAVPTSTRRNSSVDALLTALAALEDGEVLSITPDEGKSVRGTKTGIGRMANGGGFKVNSWDNGETVFVAVVERPS